jgi:S-adenosylmethionine hydrolase
MMSLVTLLTDFGTQDPFVGEMKGVMACIAPGIRFVDLTHEVAPGNVREAAWVLAKSVPWFPPGTCHLVVVDPGVGSDRRALAAEAGGHRFVGPDNGVLAPALDAAGGARIREIAVREVDRPRRGTTFDGRDRFAPVAARLALGAPLEELGPEVDDPERPGSFAPVREGDGWSAEIIRIDRFGNLVTTAEEAFLRRELGEDWRRARVTAGTMRVEGIRTAYVEADSGQALLSIGGSGVLEISVRDGSAARTLGLQAGDRVTVSLPEG